MFRWIRPLAFLVAALPACGSRYDCSLLATPGASPVLVKELQVPDSARNFAVRVRAFIPEPVNAETRLIVLSPGLDADLADADPVARTLAASNYAVAVVEHRASTSARVCAGGQKGADCWRALEESETHAENWDDRFSDILLLMDELPAQVGVDAAHIGLVGHSFGAFTTMAFGGTTYVDPRTQERRDRRDARVVSVVAMSPQGPRWFGLDDQSWDHIDRPLFLMTGDHDGTTMIDDSPEWRRVPFAHMRGGDKLMLRIEDGNHMSFTAREKHRGISELVQRAALAFIDGTMRKGDTGASLTAEAVKTCSHGHASLERR
ncbi:MAG: alpha/beta hydrolase family protein [Myxococcota bacterium]